ncbi:hypothetical protein [Bacillus pakistanensis]|uniref:hypothetical protein n=1 Tax=Rossellomorea pakistanensis TaxID=992288 RepID=UPI001963DDF9
MFVTIIVKVENTNVVNIFDTTSVLTVPTISTFMACLLMLAGFTWSMTGLKPTMILHPVEIQSKLTRLFPDY